MAASIGVPTISGIGQALTAYGVGVAAGVGYRMLSGFTGSGIIGGAAAAAVVGATVRGPMGDNLANILGFTTGQTVSLGDLGLGNLFPGLRGSGGQGNGDGQDILI